MSETRPHGVLCATSNGGGGGGSGDGTPPKRRKKPTHGDLPPVKPGGSDEPMEVVLHKGTLLKFWGGILVTILVSISAVLAFYWQSHYKAEAHISNQTIHLRSGERAQLETKKEAQTHRRRLVQAVKKETALHKREVIVKQKEEIQKIGDDLKKQQAEKLDRILQEVRKTRADVRRGGGF